MLADVPAIDLGSDEDGCQGGTGRRLKIVRAGQELVNDSVEVCGSGGSKAAEELDAWAQALAVHVPDVPKG